MRRREVLGSLVRVLLIGLAVAGCGKDSFIQEPEPLAMQVEFGEGIEIVAPTGTHVRLFADYDPISYNGRPALRLREIIGSDLVDAPDLFGYRLIGSDGFYANMPGKEYGDNTWAQLAIGYLDLIDVRVSFETERDPSLRKGHNVKWLIRVEVLRSIDVAWDGGRRLAPVGEVVPVTIPDGFPEAGTPGLMLADVAGRAAPADTPFADRLYRVLARDGTSLPRLLTWAEMREAYYVPGSDRIVMQEALGAAYQLSQPKQIRLEGGGS